MQELVKGQVSIIIPYYNARRFIKQTINSVLSQTYKLHEIILVNDGSNEDDLENYLSANFPSLVFIDKKKNTGVSDTRNTGLRVAKGEYIVFLDSDDILATNFLASRVEALSKIGDYDFCSGSVSLFKNKNDLKINFWKNKSTNLLKDILLFKPDFNTCPSNFMYKNTFLLKKNIKFNNALQSTADRCFIVEVLHNKGRHFSVSGPKSQLIYRVHNDSMSNTFSKSLVNDNLLYYQTLKNNNYVPKIYLNEFNYKMCFILSGAYKKLKMRKEFFRFLTILIFNHPIKFLSNLYKRTII